MVYSINPQQEQDSITDFLRTQYPHIEFIVGGLADDDNETLRSAISGKRTFVLLHYTQSRPTGRGRSFNDYKLDGHEAGLDAFVVSMSDEKARRFINDMGDRLVGFRTDGGGRVRKSGAIFSNGRQAVLQTNSPSRWTRTESYVYGVASKKVA